MSFRTKGFNPVLGKIFLAFVIALILDALDYAVIGLIPGIGDIFDLVGIVILFPLVGPISLAGGLELIPVVDILPIFTGLVFARLIMYGVTKK